MRVLLSTMGTRGDVEPLVGLAVRLRGLGVEVRVCAPPDCAEPFDGSGVPLVPTGPPVRPILARAAPPTAQDLARRAAASVAAHFGTVAAAARGCDALVATGVMPAGARSVAERLGICYVFASYQPATLPSPYRPPPRLPLPGRPLPPEATDNRALWDLDAQGWSAVFGTALNSHRESAGLPPVEDVRSHVFTDRPWLAADPVLSPWQEPADLDVVQTGAWILPDERPLPAGLEAFLAAGAPPVFVGFGSMPVRAPRDAAANAVEAVRAQGRRVLVSRGWAGLAPADGGGDCLAVGEVNQQALFARVAAVVHHGGAGTTTTAARAGAPQVVVPQAVDQPYWAGRVAELGIGAAHDGPEPTVASLSAALRTALAPRTRARAAAVAARIRTDGAAVAADLLLETVRGEGTPASS
ncbi:glycosyltransferase [Nocardiopsis mangrovi]|uniref:Glycosyltransferase n=1 Tax=Nocardiopsis mangrovi TaxID=1179818 RepID=A0ABV9DYJ3_9ACTN